MGTDEAPWLDGPVVGMQPAAGVKVTDR
jgi:hypothetical protein